MRMVVFYGVPLKTSPCIAYCTNVSLHLSATAECLVSIVVPLSVWPHLFHGAGHEKRRGEQLKWSLAFSLYIVQVFHVHSYQDRFMQPGWAECFLCVFSLPRFVFWLFICVSLICLGVSILLCFPEQLSHLPYRFWR